MLKSKSARTCGLIKCEECGKYGYYDVLQDKKCDYCESELKYDKNKTGGE